MENDDQGEAEHTQEHAQRQVHAGLRMQPGVGLRRQKNVAKGRLARTERHDPGSSRRLENDDQRGSCEVKSVG